jgi:hypothetical protein
MNAQTKDEKEGTMEYAAQYIVAVTQEDGTAYHYGPFSTGNDAVKFAEAEKSDEGNGDCLAIVHVLHRVRIAAR